MFLYFSFSFYRYPLLKIYNIHTRNNLHTFLKAFPFFFFKKASFIALNSFYTSMYKRSYSSCIPAPSRPSDCCRNRCNWTICLNKYLYLYGWKLKKIFFLNLRDWTFSGKLKICIFLHTKDGNKIPKNYSGPANVWILIRKNMGIINWIQDVFKNKQRYLLQASRWPRSTTSGKWCVVPC